MSENGKNIWNAAAMKVAAPLWLDEQQRQRWARIRGGRMLFAGQHREFFLDEARTSFDFPEIRVQGSAKRLYCTANILRMISLKITDLCLGEKPALRVDDQKQQAEVDVLVKRSNLHQVLFDAATEASWAGEAMVQISRYRGEVYVSNVRPDELWPVGDIGPDGQHEAYVRFAAQVVDGSTLLLETRYEPGRIVRRCWEMKADGGVAPTHAPTPALPRNTGGGGVVRGREVELSRWPVALEA